MNHKVRYKLTKGNETIIGTSEEIGKILHCSKQYITMCHCDGIRAYGYSIRKVQERKRWIMLTEPDGNVAFEGTYEDVADYLNISKRTAIQITVKNKNCMYKGYRIVKSWKWIDVN